MIIEPCRAVPSRPAGHGDAPQAAAGRTLRLSVLMPIYNERPTLAEIMRKVFAVPGDLAIEVIAVDDGSIDGSQQLLAELASLEPRIKVLRQARNCGKGAALRAALPHAQGDIVVVQDADLEYDPANYPRLLAPLLAGEADAVFGTRMTERQAASMNFWNRAANRLLTWLTNRLTGLSLTDMETGAKMIRGDVVRSLKLTSNTFTIEPELTCRLAESGARIIEVPISYARRGYAAGKKIGPWDFVKAVATLLRCRMRRSS